MKKKSTPKTSIQPTEVAKFNRLASQWWDLEGPLKTLHDINPCRMSYIKEYCELKDSSVLDLGCGGGILSEAMVKEGAIVSGVDADPDVIQIAIEHAKEQDLSISYLCSAVETLQCKPFQVITCMEMLEHVEDPAMIIEHCGRLLSPGGHLFLSTINRTMKAYFTAIIGAEYILKLLPQQTHDYQRFIKPSELATILRANGFELVDLSGMQYNPFTRRASVEGSVAVNYLMVCVKAS